MARDLEGIYPVRLTVQSLERQPAADLEEAEKGSIFIPWARPPRVGTWVALELAFADEAPTRMPGMVVWSRPPRPGVIAGFRAQLETPSAELTARLRALVKEARELAAAREAAKKRHLVEVPIEERQRTWSELTPITGPIRTVTGGEPPPRPPNWEPTPRPAGARPPSPFAPITSTTSKVAPVTAAPARSAGFATDPFAHPSPSAVPAPKPLSPPLQKMKPMPGSVVPAAPSRAFTPIAASPAPALQLDPLPGLPSRVAAQPLPLPDLPELKLDLPPAPVAAPDPPPPRPVAREMEVVELSLEQDLSIDEWNLLPQAPPDEMEAPPEEEAAPAYSEPPDAPHTLSLEAPPEEQAPQYSEPPDAPHTLYMEQPAPSDMDAPPEEPDNTSSESDDEEDPVNRTRPRWGGAFERENPEEAAPYEAPPPPPEELAAHMAVRITFSSTRTFIRHYERFFQRGEVYVASAPVPSPGTLVRVTIGIPDGDLPVVAEAVVLREVEPPEVPRAGWLARLVDMDGAIAERLAAARVMLQ